jgi:hypothetical protein
LLNRHNSVDNGNIDSVVVVVILRNQRRWRQLRHSAIFRGADAVADADAVVSAAAAAVVGVTVVVGGRECQELCVDVDINGVHIATDTLLVSDSGGAIRGGGGGGIGVRDVFGAVRHRRHRDGVCDLSRVARLLPAALTHVKVAAGGTAVTQFRGVGAPRAPESAFPTAIAHPVRAARCRVLRCVLY